MTVLPSSAQMEVLMVKLEVREGSSVKDGGGDGRFVVGILERKRRRV